MLLVLIWITSTCWGYSNEYKQHVFYRELDKSTQIKELDKSTQIKELDKSTQIKELDKSTQAVIYRLLNYLTMHL